MIPPENDRAIRVRGARQNNLRDIDVDLPHAMLSVVTGVSGSGKSSLALDTIYAEGQRRYVTSLSTYAQQFLDRLPRPDVDRIDGLPPAIAIEQRNTTLNRRSTVGTATEIYDYLRLLFARAGTITCPDCEIPVRAVPPGRVLASLGARPDSRWYVTFELPVSSAMTADVLRSNLLELGFVRVLVDGEAHHLESLPDDVDLVSGEPLFIVVDRLVAGPETETRWAEAIETAYEEGEGEAVLFPRASPIVPQARRFSRHTRCDRCKRSFPEIRPSLFSFNSPYGACEACNGFGFLLEYDPELIVPDPDASIAEGAIDPWTKPRYGRQRSALRDFAEGAGLDPDAPWRELSEEAREVLLQGGKIGGRRFQGVIPFLERLERKKYKAYVRFFLRGYQTHRLCTACGGSRLRPEASMVRVADAILPDVAERPLPEIAAWVDALGDEIGPSQIVRPIVRELGRRLHLLLAVGLDYLTLTRLTRTLSGGEAQRISIANALGSGLTDGLYVLDEPSVGLHARDTDRLLSLLRALTENGNSVLVVEHDLDVVREADHVVELGPGSGAGGGRVVFEGDPADLSEADTITGVWLREGGEASAAKRRPGGSGSISIIGARAHNLRSIDVDIPVGRLTAITGVSGSGKSTLLYDVLHRALAPAAHDRTTRADDVPFDRVLGAERVSDVILIDQTAIGKSPRSNPVTYVKAFDPIRRVFAATPAAKARGYAPGHFSFNTAAGRCESCRGDGHERVEMVFIPDVFVTCDACRGRRYAPHVLEVRWHGRSIADVLEMTIEEAASFFAGEGAVGRGLHVLRSVGLGYLRLGQPATTLSGGESQRLKIARELARGPGRTRSGGARRGNLYLMDEPTTGLHNADVETLMKVVDKLVDRGDTVVVVEHHLDVIARADHVIDLGPEGGPAGGRIVVEGTPAEVASHQTSHTGAALRARHREPAPIGG